MPFSMPSPNGPARLTNASVTRTARTRRAMPQTSSAWRPSVLRNESRKETSLSCTVVVAERLLLFLDTRLRPDPFRVGVRFGM